MSSPIDRRRPYRIAYSSSDEGGMDSSAALQQRDADTGWMSSGNADQSELILDLNQIINITRISIRSHPICSAKKIQMFGSKSKNYKDSRYTYLGEMHFQLDPFGDLKLLFLDTRQRFIMLMLSKAIEDHQNPDGHVALEFVEICGRPRGDMEDVRTESAQGDIGPNISPSPIPPSSSSAASTTRSSTARIGSASTNFCGRCGRRANSGDAFCRSCGEYL
ncbi:hypothetical protein PFISCL1PPCAC_10245 [Pristionchus fissidentatus]|uniref:Centrosomal protein CEP104 N-terminal domain-containing protein n=1 Tax=Pristionchus fissidentatus TaxID=1538716 RepID=A0AAV5VHY4_9BILA|nr:hypothetical protein PFISCL1PPCAC_10245 [Pristionchus fissidentatus]